MKTIKGKILGVLLATLVIFGLTTEQSNANAIINFDKVKKINFPCSKCFSSGISLYHGDYNYHMYKCKMDIFKLHMIERILLLNIIQRSTGKSVLVVGRVKNIIMILKLRRNGILVMINI